MIREYILMNQTWLMLRFSCERNTFDEPAVVEIGGEEELLPLYERLK